jgi:hypothetical protein
LAKSYGANVIVHGKASSSELDEVARELSAEKIVCDIADKDAVFREVNKLLEKFNAVENFARAEQLLTDDWLKSLEGMSKTEIAARLLSLTFADLLIDRPKSERAQATLSGPTVREERGAERRGGGRDRDDRRGGERRGGGRRDRDDRRSPSRSFGRDRSFSSSEASFGSGGFDRRSERRGEFGAERGGRSSEGFGGSRDFGGDRPVRFERADRGGLNMRVGRPERSERPGRSVRSDSGGFSAGRKPRFPGHEIGDRSGARESFTGSSEISEEGSGRRFKRDRDTTEQGRG